MSWDASLHCECCGAERSEFNYTSNTNVMIHEALPELMRRDRQSWWKRLDGMPGPDGARFINEIVVSLERHPDKFRAMDPPNKWGSYDSLLPVLRQMRDCVPEYPTRWRVHG